MNIVIKNYKFLRLAEMSEEQFLKLLRQAIENVQISDGINTFNLKAKVAVNKDETIFIVDKE